VLRIELQGGGEIPDCLLKIATPGVAQSALIKVVDRLDIGLCGRVPFLFGAVECGQCKGSKIHDLPNRFDTSGVLSCRLRLRARLCCGLRHRAWSASAMPQERLLSLWLTGSQYDP